MRWPLQCRSSIWVFGFGLDDERMGKGRGQPRKLAPFHATARGALPPPPAFLRFATGSHPHRRRVSRVRVVDATRLLRNQKAGVEYGGRDTRRPTIWGVCQAAYGLSRLRACLGISGMNENEGYWGGGISIISQIFPKSPSILFHPLDSSISS
jgi:hypothetical protein